MSVGRFSQLAAMFEISGQLWKKKAVKYFLDTPPTCNSQCWRSQWESSQGMIKDALETSLWS